jgi:hypothetical protein
MLRKNLEIAIASALSIVFPYYLLIKWEARFYDQGHFPNRDTILILSLFPLAFIGAAISFWLGRNTPFGRKSPHWLGIPFVGSGLLIVFSFLYQAALHRNIQSITFEVMMNACLIGLGLGIYSLPFAALVNYSASIIGAIKSWHHGPKLAPSLFSKRIY